MSMSRTHFHWTAEVSTGVTEKYGCCDTRIEIHRFIKVGRSLFCGTIFLPNARSGRGIPPLSISPEVSPVFPEFMDILGDFFFPYQIRESKDRATLQSEVKPSETDFGPYY